MYKDNSLSMLHTPEPIKENKTISDIRKENSNTHKILKEIKSLFEPEPIKKVDCQRHFDRLSKKIPILTKYLETLESYLNQKKND